MSQSPSTSAACMQAATDTESRIAQTRRLLCCVCNHNIDGNGEMCTSCDEFFSGRIVNRTSCQREPTLDELRSDNYTIRRICNKCGRLIDPSLGKVVQQVATVTSRREGSDQSPSAMKTQLGRAVGEDGERTSSGAKRSWTHIGNEEKREKRIMRSESRHYTIQTDAWPFFNRVLGFYFNGGCCISLPEAQKNLLSFKVFTYNHELDGTQTIFFNQTSIPVRNDDDTNDAINCFIKSSAESTEKFNELVFQFSSSTILKENLYPIFTKIQYAFVDRLHGIGKKIEVRKLKLETSETEFLTRILQFLAPSSLHEILLNHVDHSFRDFKHSIDLSEAAKLPVWKNTKIIHIYSYMVTSSVLDFANVTKGGIKIKNISCSEFDELVKCFCANKQFDQFIIKLKKSVAMAVLGCSNEAILSNTREYRTPFENRELVLRTYFVGDEAAFTFKNHKTEPIFQDYRRSLPSF